jgi:hypothetical protein
MTAKAELETRRDDPWAVMEKVVVQGDLSNLSAADRVSYYRSVCESVGLNPLTQPFAYITLNGRLTLYAMKGATDQIRATHRVAVTIVSRERLDDVYVVTARATMPDGRTDESIGAVPIKGLAGDALANALMKAETKAKRRVTLSVVGLGMLDESETETIRGAQFAALDDAGDDDGPTLDEQLPGEFERTSPSVRSIDQQLQRDIERIIGEANELTETRHRGKFGLLMTEALKLGLRGDPEVMGALEEAKARLFPDETAAKQPSLIKA